MNDSLKHHLLGPSLQKSGQDGVDQAKVAEIIYNASKGSKFFNNESQKDKNLTEKIARTLARKRQLERLDLDHDLRRADDYITELELSRDLSQTVVHIDCDAFYAAVEELDRPELKDVPMAVGKGVLTTCNYHARKFGCRSGMAGFVAMKLCPELICLPLNFDKYTAKAREVRAVLELYDSRFESASIDEAYLNITDYCKAHDMSPWDVVQQLRAEVHEKTKITVSAGIAANAKLAKICSNKNKPNGQFMLETSRAAIIAFMKDLPTRKVNGIGRVFERELDAVGIKTCGDIYAQRAYLSKLFGEKAFQFLMQCYLGLGRTKIQPAEEYERKSVGTESTFRELTGKEGLRKKLRQIAEELEKDLERTHFKGRTLVLKVKLATYEVLTRQTTPPFAVWRADDLEKYAIPMLAKLEREMPGLTLRLMGLRVTHIVSLKKSSADDFFGLNRRTASTDSALATTDTDTDDALPLPFPTTVTAANGEDDDGGGDPHAPTWPEAEFEEAARQEREADFHETLRLSQQQQQQQQQQEQAEEAAAVAAAAASAADTAAQLAAVPAAWDCPICQRPQPANDRAFNSHIDFCLSRDEIKATVRQVNEAPSASGVGGGSAGVDDGGAVPSRSRERPATAFELMRMGAAGGAAGAAGGSGSGGGKKRGRPPAREGLLKRGRLR